MPDTEPTSSGAEAIADDAIDAIETIDGFDGADAMVDETPEVEADV